jgi:predicted Zn-dependent protease
MDRRITIISDPSDPIGGYTPFILGRDFAGMPVQRTTWVDHGVLKDLAYDEFYALGQGKPIGVTPMAMRMGDGTTSVDDMIKTCREGIYVNRFSDLTIVDSMTGMMTGATRDGCFLVRDGKITKSVKNFRILDSPFLFLNNVEAIGPSGRVPLGYAPPDPGEDTRDFRTAWPRPPVIVPPLTIRDFNFAGLSDAV